MYCLMALLTMEPKIVKIIVMQIPLPYYEYDDSLL